MQGRQALLQTEGVCIVRPAVAQALGLQQLGWRTRQSANIQPDLILSQKGVSVAFLLLHPQLQPASAGQALQTRHARTGPRMRGGSGELGRARAGSSAWAGPSSTASCCTAILRP